MKYIVFFLLSVPGTLAGGGNCKNVCNFQIDNHWDNCLSENCPQNGDIDLCPRGNATTCVCSEDCQQCVADLYNECGGCTDKSGYNFDVDVLPGYKSVVDAMGCSGAGAGIARVTISAMCICLAVTAYSTLC
mmetsp:Transcript_11079/g.20043  ORF Transcript_11079/g.20043 Transcript_11079/m.20043 type:complete len:132 (+) Transcript_11079:1313-1708(+)